MMKNKVIALAMFCMALFGACGKDPNPNGERFRILKDKEQINVGSHSVSISGEYAYSGKINGMKLRIGTDENLNGASDHSVAVNGLSYSVEITGLNPATLYRYQYLVDYGSVTEYASETYTFTTAIEENPPLVTTVGVQAVTVNSATCVSNVDDDCGSEVTERGVCWSTTPDPTVNDMVYANGHGLGEYRVDLFDLTPNTTYYVCAYAKNSKGVGYGEVLSFTTLFPLDDPPFAAIRGLFMVAEGRQVWFSQGNLQYKATSKAWGFAEDQYGYIGENNAHIAEDYNGYIDLFGWGTSGNNHGAVCYQPYSTSEESDNYWAYGDMANQLYDQTGKADWGYNRIHGGVNVNQWRTLTIDEWLYLFHERVTPSGIRFAKAQVDGINGVVLLPDYWSEAYYHLNNVNIDEASFVSNVITKLAWYVSLEENGAVFLPAAGRRQGRIVEYVGNEGYYHSSECRNNYARGIIIANYIGEHSISRFRGASVRLVQDVK